MKLCGFLLLLLSTSAAVKWRTPRRPQSELPDVAPEREVWGPLLELLQMFIEGIKQVRRVAFLLLYNQTYSIYFAK